MTMVKRLLSATLLASALVVVASAQVGPQSISLGGNAQYDGWKSFKTANYPNSTANPQYGGGFPGSLPWVAPIASDLDGSGDSTFGKTSGTAYIAEASIYNGGFSGDTNVQGASFSVVDPTAVANLKTVVFQLEAAASFGDLTFYNDIEPTLTVNGGTALAATFTTLFASTPAGNGPLGNPATADLVAYQWDLSGVATPITSYSISWTNVQHALVYSARLDSTDQAYTEAVPEPASMAALALGALALVRRKRR